MFILVADYSGILIKKFLQIQTKTNFELQIPFQGCSLHLNAFTFCMQE
jgi:hypothetical protein